MNEAELRAMWEEGASTTDKEVLNLLWQDLTDRGDVDYALIEPESGLKDLLTVSEEWLKYWRLGSKRAKPVGRSRRTTIEVEITHYERRCAEALSPYLAKQATRLASVRTFRNGNLGAGLLTQEQAMEFLTQEWVGNLPGPDVLSKYGLSLDGLVRWLKHLGKGELLQHVIPSELPHPSAAQDLLHPISSKGVQGEWFRPGEEEGVGNLGRLSVRLATIFPWTPASAAWFVLTGEPPEIAPLTLSYHLRRGQFTLTYAQWISEKTLRRAYAGARDHLRQGDNRPLAHKTLAVFRFVTEHVDDEGNRQSWAQLTDLWNKQHPGEWRFKDRFGLRKTYLRAEKELADPWH